MTEAYGEIISKGVEALKHVLRGRADASNVKVWAVPTTEDRDGYLYVGDQCFETGATIIEPNLEGVSTYRNWGAVPYATMRTILWNGCRRKSIMPRVSRF